MSQALGEPQPPHRKPLFVAVAGLAALAAVGCSSEASTDAAADAPATVTVTAEAPSSAAVAPSPEAASTSAAPVTSEAAVVVDFVMPNFVGTDLQTAQNAVQEAGVFYSVSHDLLGSRNQMLDSGWIVCTQNVAPGQRVTGDVEGQIDFGVVKREEFCP